MGDGVSAMFAGVAIGLLCFLWPHIAALRKRIARVEGKLDVLLKNAELQYDPFSDVPKEVADAVRSGNKMLAVKQYREATDCSLREAREEIDDLFRLGGFGATVDTDGAKAFLIVISSMVVCSLAGALVPLLFWMPDPGSHMLFVVMLPGGIVGSFAGMILGIFIFRKAQQRRLKNGEGASENL